MCLAYFSFETKLTGVARESTALAIAGAAA
jgi:hypothetical protein